MTFISICVVNILKTGNVIPKFSVLHNVNKVKSANFGHQINSDIHLQTVEILMRRPSHQDFHCLLS